MADGKFVFDGWSVSCLMLASAGTGAGVAVVAEEARIISGSGVMMVCFALYGVLLITSAVANQIRKAEEESDEQ